MDNNINIILIIVFFISFIIGIIFSIRFILFYKYQYLTISIALCILFFFIIFMIVFYRYPKDIYPQNTNPCPDFWEIQMDGTCKINPSNTGSIETTDTDYFYINNPKYYVPGSNDNSKYKSEHINGYNYESIPFGYDVKNGKVDFTDVRWSTYNGGESRNCALKAWSNKNGVIWDGIHNYNGCKT